MHQSTFLHRLFAVFFVWLASIINTHAIAANQDRVLFVVASSKVHGDSELLASISFGEVVHAWDIFHAADYAVDFVSPDGGAVPILDDYVNDPIEPRLQDERIMGGLRNTAKPAQIDPARYKAVYYVGGSNAMYGVAENTALQQIAMHVYERNNGVVSAVCHGTAGIVNLKLANGQYLIQGKRITGYPEAYEDQDAAYFKEFPFLIGQTVKARGGDFRVQEQDQSHVEVDGRVVTGQNYDSTFKVAQAVVKILATSPQSAADEEVTKAMQTMMRAFEASDANIAWQVLRKDGIVLGYASASGKIASQTTAEWIKGFQGKPAADEAQRHRRFEVLDVEANGAVVKVILDYPSWKGVDYFALSKIDGKWMIISKSWSAQGESLNSAAQHIERQAVSAVAQKFIDAYSLEDGTALMSEAFHPEGKMLGYAPRNAAIDVVPGSEFVSRFTGVADDENLRKRSFEILDITQNSALVKATMNYPTWLGTDYLALAKIAGDWKIISKSWSGVVKAAK
jgi:putative intracellular protease/amidase